MPKSNPLKSKIKQTFVLNMNIEMVLSLIQKQFGTSWQIESRRLDSDTIDFRASREGVEILGHLERWQGTDSRLHLDAQVLSKVPYETWREWSGVSTFIALLALWALLARLPLTASAFQNLFYLIGISGVLGMLGMALLVAIYLGLPFLAHRYFTQLSPDIRFYEEVQTHMANFVSEIRTLDKHTNPDTSRLEDHEAESLAEGSSINKQLSKG